MGSIEGGNRRRKGAVSAVNVGHPIVTNGDLVALLFSAVRGGDAALPKLLWDFLLYLSIINTCRPECVHVAKQVSVTDEKRNQESVTLFTRKRCKEP